MDLIKLKDEFFRDRAARKKGSAGSCKAYRSAFRQTWAFGRETGLELDTERAAELPPGTAAFGREIAVSGEIGAFVVSGRIDFVLVLWNGKRLRFRLVECKASRKDQTYHRIQLVLYRILLRRLLSGSPLVSGGATVTPDVVECVVARIGETTDTVHDVLALPTLDLQIEEEDVVRLLAAAPSVPSPDPAGGA